jgi:hypothetical protein
MTPPNLAAMPIGAWAEDHLEKKGNTCPRTRGWVGGQDSLMKKKLRLTLRRTDIYPNAVRACKDLTFRAHVGMGGDPHVILYKV